MSEDEMCQVFAGLMDALGWWPTVKRFKHTSGESSWRLWTHDGLLVGFWDPDGFVWPDRTIEALRELDPTKTLENHARRVAGKRVDDAAADVILGLLYDFDPRLAAKVNA